MVDFGATLPYGFDEELTPLMKVRILARIDENVTDPHERTMILDMLGLSDLASETTTDVA